jgi:hypothetical protein
LAADEGLPYVQAALEQLHVLPAEAEQVSSAQGRTEGYLHHAPGEAPPLALCLGGLLLSLAVGGEEAGDLRLESTLISGGSACGASISSSGLRATRRQRRATLNMTRRRPRWLLIVFGERPAAACSAM